MNAILLTLLSFASPLAPVTPLAVVTSPAPALPEPAPAAPAVKTSASAIVAAADNVAPDVRDAVAKMQAFYERTRGFDTRFQQSFQQAGVPSRLAGSTAKGRIRFRKPDGAAGGPLMRWDYDDGRILLLVKDLSYTYDPDTKQAVEYPVDTANLSAAVTFMWGKGRLAEEFKIAKASRSLGEGLTLELTPVKPAGGYSKVFLLVNPDTGVVLQSLVVQSNGSENRITFVDPKLNSEVKPADFDPNAVFPKGTARVKATIPGR